jgi:hypothetical protein
MSSNYPPNLHFGWNAGMSSVMFNVHNFTHPGGSTQNDFVLRDPLDGEPVGYVHFHQSGGADVSYSGFVNPYPLATLAAHVPLLFIKNDGPNNIILLEESGLSAAPNRFNFGGGGNQTLPPATSFGASILLIYDPDLLRWQPGP